MKARFPGPCRMWWEYQRDKLHQKGNVLDYGCGPGSYIVPLLLLWKSWLAAFRLVSVNEDVVSTTVYSSILVVFSASASSLLIPASFSADNFLSFLAKSSIISCLSRILRQLTAPHSWNSWKILRVVYSTNSKSLTAQRQNLLQNRSCDRSVYPRVLKPQVDLPFPLPEVSGNRGGSGGRVGHRRRYIFCSHGSGQWSRSVLGCIFDALFLLWFYANGPSRPSSSGSYWPLAA